MAEAKKQQRVVDLDQQLARLKTANRGNTGTVTLPRSESPKSSRRAGRESAVDRFLSEFADLLGEGSRNNRRTRTNRGHSTPKVRD